VTAPRENWEIPVPSPETSKTYQEEYNFLIICKANLDDPLGILDIFFFAIAG
jgi:hypothetical protein